MIWVFFGLRLKFNQKLIFSVQNLISPNFMVLMSWQVVFVTLSPLISLGYCECTSFIYYQPYLDICTYLSYFGAYRIRVKCCSSGYHATNKKRQTSGWSRIDGKPMSDKCRAYLTQGKNILYISQYWCLGFIGLMSSCLIIIILYPKEI